MNDRVEPLVAAGDGEQKRETETSPIDTKLGGERVEEKKEENVGQYARKGEKTEQNRFRTGMRKKIHTTKV